MQEKYRDPYPYGFGNVIKASEEVVGYKGDGHRWICGTSIGKYDMVQRFEDSWADARALRSTYFAEMTIPQKE